MTDNMNTQVKPLEEQLETEFIYYKNEFYCDTFNEEYVYGYDSFADFEKYVKTVNIDHLDIQWLERVSALHFEYYIFKEYQNKKEEALKHLSISCQYGFYALRYGSKSCGCFENKNPFIIQNKAVFMMSNLLLTSNIDEFKEVANYLIDSLNGESCIIKKGYKESTISWFILELCSKYLNKPIKLHKLLQPKLEFPFKDAIEKFESEDIKEVEKLIYLLCDTHIDIAKQNLEVQKLIIDGEQDERKEAEDKYKELFLVGLYQLPFEVFVWLRLRELKGLKNPDFSNSSKEFVHPLLQTKISNFYLSFKDKKIELNNDLIYANKLIEKLKKNCKNFE